MGSETRVSNPGLMQALMEKPYSFNFFQVIRLLQKYTGGASLGGPGPAEEETLRIQPAVSLSFPAADLQRIEAMGQETASGSARYRIVTSFMGLFSTDSPLPTFYTEDRFWKEDNQDAVKEFVDIFHHRALSLYFRAWEKYRYGIQFRQGGADVFSRRIFSLLGLDTTPKIQSTGLDSVRLLRYAGLVTQRPHSAAVLANILKDYFVLPGVEIQQCVPRWVHIDKSQQNRLGIKNCTLGKDFYLGGKVRDYSGKFRVVAGPLGISDFLRFTPETRDYAAIINLIRFYATDRLDFDVKIKLRKEEVPPLRLSSRDPQRLGWTSCLPNPRHDIAVLFRQPENQSPQTTFPWPGSASKSAGDRGETRS